MKYRPEIDGLRAVAVLPVILFHAGFSIFSGGFVGVDVFFVISGYLITSIILKDLETGSFSFWEFYERRARRILPALFFVIICCIPFAWMWMMPTELKAFSTSVVAVSVFMSNILFWRQSGYFDTAAELKPLLHTWSLAVEEQFYIFFPIAMLILWRFGRKNVVAAIALVAVVSLALSEYGSRYHPSFNFYWLPTRAWELAAGSLCAFVAIKPTAIRDDVLSAAGLAAIVFAIFYYDSTTPFSSLYALLPVLGTCAIILFAQQGTIVGSLLSLKAFVGIGLISYSAYLWHQPLFAFARLRSLFEPAWQLMIVLAACSLVLAYFSWRYIEVPARKRGVWPIPRRKTVFAVSGLSALLFIVFGLSGHLSNGFEGQFSERQKALISTALPSPMRNRCHFNSGNSFTAADSCIYFGSTPDVAVFGNSHGVELAYGLASALNKSGKSLIHFTISGCEPSFGRITNDHCDRFYSERIDYILSEQRVKIVILAFRAESSNAGATSVIDLANHLSRAGKSVIIILQAPTLEADINRFIRLAVTRGLETFPSKKRETWIAENKPLYSQLDRLDGQVRVVDLADLFCDAQTCYAIRDNIAMYFDDDHMSVTAAMKVGSDVFRLLTMGI